MGLELIKKYGGQRLRSKEGRKLSAIGEINGVQLRKFLYDYRKMFHSQKNPAGEDLSASALSEIRRQINLMKTELNGRSVRCGHSQKLHDDYGTSCFDCGVQLEGFGFGGHSGMNLTGTEKCIHVFPKEGIAVCKFCEQGDLSDLRQ